MRDNESSRPFYFILSLFLSLFVRFFSEVNVLYGCLCVCRQLIMFAHSRTLIGVRCPANTICKPCSALLFSHDCHRCRTCSILYCIFVFVSLFITQINCIHIETHTYTLFVYILCISLLFCHSFIDFNLVCVLQSVFIHSINICDTLHL